MVSLLQAVRVAECSNLLEIGVCGLVRIVLLQHVTERDGQPAPPPPSHHAELVRAKLSWPPPLGSFARLFFVLRQNAHTPEQIEYELRCR